MRSIIKRAPPASLSAWRTPRLVKTPEPGMVCSYDEMRREPAVLREVENGLLAEQGQLCAYTGRRIRFKKRPDGAEEPADFHIEHVKAQARCRKEEQEGGVRGQDTDYANMVACWPQKGFKDPPYGAVPKKDWPGPTEDCLFISPLRSGLASRFRFDDLGRVSTDQDDAAAQETIKRLVLDHDALTDLRKAAIEGALRPNGRSLSLLDLQKLLTDLQKDNSDLAKQVPTKLRAYCFAIEQALEREVQQRTAQAAQQQAAPAAKR